jgi:hypothetical protein
MSEWHGAYECSKRGLRSVEMPFAVAMCGLLGTCPVNFAKKMWLI